MADDPPFPTKTVMRYTDGGPDGWMQSPTGEFVKWEDYARLERENRELLQLVPPDKYVWKLPDEPRDELEALRKERYWLRSALGAIIGLFHDQEHEAKNIARRVLDSTALNREVTR